MQFQGPYEVIKDLGRGRVQLGDSTGKLLKKSYNVNRLKLWLEPNKVKVMEKARTDVLPEESTPAHECNDESDAWIPDLNLKKVHRFMLQNDEPLDDCVIQAAQTLLHRQFPHIEGLQPTIYSQKLMDFKELREGSENIQIHHTGAFHWVTSTTIGRSKFAVARILDSIVVTGKRLPSSLECQIARIYSGKKEKFNVEVSSVQQQEGADDCGVFAIAFAVEVAFGGNPSKVIYRQEAMRNHLEDSFNNRKLSPFPRGEMGKKSVRKLTKIEVHCLCFLPESYDNMVQCEDCFTWFHYGCVNYLETDKNYGWKCVDCSPKKKKQKF